MRKSSLPLILLAAIACNGEATAPGGPIPIVPPPPTPQPLSFPLRNTIAYISYRYDPAGDVFLIDANGKKTRVTDTATRDNCPTISPDGGALAYYSDGLVLQSAAGKLRLPGGCAVWSADGSKLFSFAGAPAPAGRVFTRSGQLLATLEESGLAAAISADEKYYARIRSECPSKGPCRWFVWLSQLQNFAVVSSSLVDEAARPTMLSFSPDGRTLAFVCGEINAVCLADVATATVIRRIENAAHPAWSPVANTLAYVCDRERDPAALGRGSVCIASPSGSDRKLEVKASAVSWSLDGSALLLKSGQANTDLYVVNAADGSNVRNITRDRGREEIGSWAPFLGSPTAAVFGEPPQLTSSAAKLSENELVYEGPVEDRRIWAVSRTGTGRRRLFNVDNDERCVALSPDRRFVAFVSRGLWVSSVDGRVEKQLRDSTIAFTEQFGCPKWSPDGTHLAWLTGAPGIQMQLWAGRFDGSDTRVLAQGGDLETIVWDFESRSVFHYLHGQRMRSYLDGSSQSSVPEWDSMRADGKLLIRCKGEICIADANGNVEKNLGLGYDPRWSPDGSHFIFTRIADPGFAIMLAKADGSDLRQIATSAAASWSSSGTALALRKTLETIAITRLDGTVENEFNTPDMWRLVWGFETGSKHR